MVRLDGVDDDGVLLVLSGEFDAQLDVAAFHLVVNGLAEVVQQTGTLCQRHIDAKFGRHQTRNMRNLNGVVQHVLAIGRAVFLAAQKLNEFGVQIVDTGFKRRAFAFNLDGVVNLAASLFNHVFNAGRMDAAVGNQLFERKPCDLTADGIERGNRDGLRGVVDDEVNAGDGFKGADVAALAADDAALHFIVGQRNDGDGGLGGMVCRAALDGGGDDLAGRLIGLLLHLRFDLLDLHRSFVAHVVFDVLEDIGLGFVLRQAGDLFQNLHLAALERIDLFLLLVDGRDLLGQLVLFLLVKIDLLVKGFFLLLQTALLLGDFRAALLDFLLIFAA